MNRYLLLIVGALVIGLIGCSGEQQMEDTLPVDTTPEDTPDAGQPVEEPVEADTQELEAGLEDISGELVEDLDLGELDDLDAELGDFDW